MERPEPQEEHKKLMRFVGSWSGDELVHHSPFTSRERAVGTWMFRSLLNGFFIVGDYLEQNEDGVVMRGHAVIGVDVKHRQYTLHWFDTFGSPPLKPMVGQWRGNELVFTQEHGQGESMTVFAIDEGWLTFRAEAEGNPILEGRYRRVGKADPIYATP
jgi:hypothetical protein